MLCLLLGLFVVCFFDYKYGKIPNPAVFLLAPAGGVYAFLQGGVGEMFFSILRAIIVGGMFYTVFKIGALGAGDVKLFSACTIFFKGNEIIVFIFISFVAAAILAILKTIRERDFFARCEKLAEYTKNYLLSGRFELYNRDRNELRRNGICMAGPMLVGVICKMGGLY